MSRVDIDPGIRGRPIPRKALTAAALGIVLAACRSDASSLSSSTPRQPAKDTSNIPRFDTEDDLLQRDREVTLGLIRRTVNPDFLDRYGDHVGYHPGLMAHQPEQFASVGSFVTLGTQQEVEIQVDNDYRGSDSPERSTFEIHVLRSDRSGRKSALAEPDLAPDKSGVPRIRLDKLKQMASDVFILPETLVWEERDFIAFGQGQYQDGRKVGVTVINNGEITLEIRSEHLPPPRSPLPPLRKEE